MPKNKPLLNLPFQKINSQNFFCLLAGLMVLFHCFFFIRQIQNQDSRKSLDIRPVEKLFSEMREVLKDIPTIGYFSDRDLSSKTGNVHLSFAQYSLAPTILDFENLEHEFILFDCSNLTKAKNKMRAMHVTPIKINRSGYILAVKTK